jgi:hypothetical protein
MSSATGVSSERGHALKAGGAAVDRDSQGSEHCSDQRAVPAKLIDWSLPETGDVMECQAWAGRGGCSVDWQTPQTGD